MYKYNTFLKTIDKSYYQNQFFKIIDRDQLFNIKQLTKGNNMNNLKKVGLTALGTA